MTHFDRMSVIVVQCENGDLYYGVISQFIAGGIELEHVMGLCSFTGPAMPSLVQTGTIDRIWKLPPTWIPNHKIVSATRWPFKVPPKESSD